MQQVHPKLRKDKAMYLNYTNQWFSDFPLKNKREQTHARAFWKLQETSNENRLKCFML